MKTHLLTFVCVFLFSNTSITAQLFNEKQKVIPSERLVSGRYGQSVDISGNYAIIGLNKNDTDILGLDTMPSAGAAYIFEKNSTGDWIEIQKLVAPDRSSPDRFGLSVSISGNLAAIGSANSYDIAGLNYENNAGAVYIFERNTNTGQWDFVQKLVASDRDQEDEFSIVAISGNNLIVGAPGEKYNNDLQAGAVYGFSRNTSTSLWTETYKVVAPNRHAGDQFGYAVDLDGTDGIIGAPFDDYAGLNNYLGSNAGAAYSLSGGGAVSRLGHIDMASEDKFGTSVTISNGWRIVGAPYHEPLSSIISGAVYCFFGSSPAVELYASDHEAYDLFGSSVAIDGNRLLVGATSNDHSTLNGFAFQGGSVYIFEKNTSGIWNELEKITASDRSAYDTFGNAVAISGTDILVGAYRDTDDLNGANQLFDAGSAYFFHYCPTRTSTINVSACNGGYTSPSGRHYWTNSNTYTDVLWGGAVSGCDSIITINLTISAGTVDTSITISGNILISNELAATWQWIDCATNQPIPGATNRSFNHGAQGNSSYAVVVTTNTGCVGASACYPMNITSVATIDDKTNFTIFPNPTTGLLSLNLGKLHSNIDIEVVSITGQLLLQKQYDKKEQIKLNLSEMLSGVYFIKIKTAEGTPTVFKILKS